MTQKTGTSLQQVLDVRYSDAPRVAGMEPLLGLAARGSCREFRDQPVPMDLLQVLCAAALASPTKSDLQQRDIILLQAPEKRQQLAALVGGQKWVADAPMIAVFCGNNRRQRQMHDWHDVPFANDHFDAVFNATADAAIALGAFVIAAEAMGLGCCPISAVRNEAAAISTLLNLPDHVFPFAGLALGYPGTAPTISKRLPLGVTCHVNEFSETGLRATIAEYNAEREASQPFEKQRFMSTFGYAETYGWSDDKVRQYSQPERADFGAYLRDRGFQMT